jgi:hypothetical protein
VRITWWAILFDEVNTTMATRFQINVGQTQGDLTGNTNVVIQAAVDQLAALGGGEVRVLPGVYEMQNSLHLRSHVFVRGSGPDTVFHKPASVSSAMPAFLGYGHYDITVAEPSRFCVGMGVLLHDDESRGFYDTVATLLWQDGNRFGIDKMLNHDYHIDNHATVTSVYPLISGADLTDAGVQDLVIDGNAENNAHLNGCRGGGVYLIQAHDVTLRNLLVHNFNGDGISFQQCVRTVIEDCQLLSNTGHGLHPGSGSVAPVIRRCKVSRNGNDGIFYCLRVTYSVCEDCDIVGNAHDGVSIGERDTHHHIRNNRIGTSGRYGIYFRETVPGYGGGDNLIEGNRIYDNCQADGNAEIHIARDTQRIQILKNHFGPAHKPMVAITVGDNCKEITVANNEADLLYRPTIQAAPTASVSLQTPGERMPVGPGFVPTDGMLHLNIRTPRFA